MRARLVGVVGVVAALALVVAAAVVTAVVLLTDQGGTGAGRGPSGAVGSASPGPGREVSPSTATSQVEEPPDPHDPAYDVARSTPLEDSYYPDRGDPGVDALHYGLDLAWDPEASILTGTADIALRATADAEVLQLDLLAALTVTELSVDGIETGFRRAGDHLVIEHAVARGERLALRLRYAGTPAPVPAPSARLDLSSIGAHVMADGQIWTMQEPFGAFTWYPVNDQPSDKALYDFTLRAPEGWVGIANGVLDSRTVEDGRVVTEWHLAQPAASYLTTLAFGDFVETEDRSASGVPISYWTHRGNDHALRALRVTPKVLSWAERRLGPYPFDSLSILVVGSESGMETQTMITLGNTDYALSRPVIAHEVTHQWYGDLVTPTDWRDVWMNEGMAMFVQGAYEADQEGLSIDEKIDTWAFRERLFRRQSGPPGAYDAGEFGAGNVYYGPALMWNELRHRMGNRAFWAMVRKWPTVHADANATRRQYTAWLEHESGLELTSFLDSWIMGARTPSR